MVRLRKQVAYALGMTLIFSISSAIHASAADCNPTTSVGSDGYTTAVFTNSSAANNTNGSNTAVTCTWKAPLGVTSLYVVVVGGGGSGGFGNQAGGGGGGQVLYTQSEIRISSGAIHTIVVGAGGAGTSTQNTSGNDGAMSSFNGFTANGGGGGGGGGPYSGLINFGRPGGSSGGGNRFGITSTQANRATASGWIALGSAGGAGAGRQDNNAGNADTAGAQNCWAYGQGGGGGGAMSAGQNASATCTGSRAQDAITVSGGAGGAGAYILGRCLGGGGSAGTPISGASGTTNKGTGTLTNPTTTACQDAFTKITVLGSQSGGGYAQAGVANTGGGGSALDLGAGTSYSGANGVVLVKYFLGITSGLVASFDAQNPASCAGSCTTWSDLSGNGYNAALTGASKSSSNGGYMNFSGSTQYATLPTLPSSISWSSGFTVSFYANFASNNAWQRIIDFGAGQATNNILVARSGTSNNLHVEVYQDANNISNCNWANAAPTNEWHHYAVGFNGSDCFLYIDGSATSATLTRTKVTAGVPTNPGSITAVPANSNRTFSYIAKSNWNADGYYAGGIRSLAIYNRGLDSTEIQIEKLYQADVSAPTISSISFTSSPVGTSYLSGETITVSTTWSETVVVSSLPQIPILGLTSRNLVYSSGSGSKTLTFTYTVASGDLAISGIGLTANSFDTGPGSITDLSYNTPNYNFTGISISSLQKVGNLLATISLSLPGNAATTTYRLPVSITATVSAPGKVTFYFLGKVIAGCRNIQTVTSGSITATCNWKPAVHNSVQLKASIAPSNGMTAASNTLNIQVLRRATNR
jgi:hypothetical protein